MQAVLVWLTVVTTLIASVPHFDCVCPNGKHKPFCLGVCSSRTGGCCCGGSCCVSASGEKCCGQAQQPSSDPQGEQSCCGESKEQSKPDTPAKVNQVKGSCCTKTLAQGAFVVTPTKVTAEQNGLSVPVSPSTVVLPAPMPAASLLSWEHQLPPPTDLVITLQHFLI